MRLRDTLLLTCLLGFTTVLTAQAKIVFLAGEADSHPRGTHEYQKACVLLADALRHASNVEGLRCDVHLGGWPEHQDTLDDADTIVVISSGGDQAAPPHPLLVGSRMEVLAQQMRRGCGLVVLHWSTFVPNGEHGDRFLEWIGGYFDYQSGPGPRRWLSKIKTGLAAPGMATPGHPIARGVPTLGFKEEFYYDIRFRPRDPRRVDIVKTRIAGVRGEHVVGWAVERKDGGRGFGYTGGHYFDHFLRPGVQKMLCNAILWSAKVPVPKVGVLTSDAAPIRALIVTGHQHPAHDWRATTEALRESILLDPRMRVTVTEDVSDLARLDRAQHDVVVLNYCNWQRSGLSPAARKRFLEFVAGGGGLVVTHFANGAFHPSLPNTPDSDWPEYRKHLVRRVWDHAKGRSGHDKYGRFQITAQSPEHPILGGSEGWETIDELYYRQAGTAPIDPLITARSADTARNEPLAWCYRYGKGLIFQTVLGHDARSLRVPGTARMMRRATSWSAGRQPAQLPGPRPRTSLVKGRFGRALDARVGTVEFIGGPKLGKPPISVECWARLDDAKGFNVCVSNERKNSGTHWELYSYTGDGTLSAYLPGFQPSEVRSKAVVTDQRWHHLAMTFDGKEVRLFVDGAEVARKSVLPRQGVRSEAGRLYIGGAVHPNHRVGCRGAVDEVRVSAMLRKFEAPIRSRPELDGETLGLWRFDGDLSDASKGAAETEAWTPTAVADPHAPWVLEKEKDWFDERPIRMDYGPGFASSIRTPGHPSSRITYKALAVRLGAKTLVFDTQNVRFVGLWDGGIEIFSKRFGLLEMPRLKGKPLLSLARAPVEGRTPFAPLPRDEGRWLGHALSDRRLVLDYEIAGIRVRELPRAVDGGLLREFRIAAARHPIRIPVATGAERKRFTVSGGELRSEGGTLWMQVAPAAASRRVQLRWSTTLGALPTPIPIADRPAESTEPIVTRGRLGGVGAYVVDTLVLPDDNPHRAVLFASGLDFLPNGQLAVSTAHGDVWLCAGVDGDLDRLSWRRMATGLYQPLGLVVVKGQVYVRGRDQITRLEDRNGDGIADTYHCFSNVLEISGQPHAYAMNLEVDSAGNFWSVKSGAKNTRHGGSLLRISPDGQSILRFSFGYRHANGLGIGPGDVVTTADNEGGWTPATRIDIAKKGRFYGFVPALRDGKRENDDERPLLWLPKEADNSAGSQVWTPSEWGPLGGKMLHLSYGRCRALVVLTEEIGGVRQAAAVDLPWRFASGICRGRFGPDGQLYVCGLDGWQTAAERDGCVQRVRFTGARFDVPIGFETRSNGMVLKFAAPLRTDIRPTAFTVDRWNYRRAASYGSKDWSVSDPGRQGKDRLRVERVVFSKDGRSVFLGLSDMRPAMQIRIRWILRNDLGGPVTGRMWSTAHVLGERFESFR